MEEIEEEELIMLSPMSDLLLGIVFHCITQVLLLHMTLFSIQFQTILIRTGLDRLNNPVCSAFKRYLKGPVLSILMHKYTVHTGSERVEDGGGEGSGGWREDGEGRGDTVIRAQRRVIWRRCVG